MTQQIALVTGGSRGIGASICLKLAEDGFHVLVAGRSAARLEQTVAQIRENGGSADAYELDVCAFSDHASSMKQLVKDHGGLHVLVNNAGITQDNLMAKINEQAFDSVIDTNLKGAFFLSQACLRPMMKQRWGRIINISSVVGLMGNPGQTNYAASKAGILGLTKSLAREIASRKVTVNAVAPGYIETEMTDGLSDEVKESFSKQIPLGRMGSAQEVAAVVSFLASEGSSYITGQIISVDGGLYM